MSDEAIPIQPGDGGDGAPAPSEVQRRVDDVGEEYLSELSAGNDPDRQALLEPSEEPVEKEQPAESRDPSLR